MTTGPTLLDEAGKPRGLWLALDMTTRDGAFALWRDGVSIAKQTLPPATSDHDALFGSIQAAFKSAELSFAQLNLFAFANGPGSFTGLRIASTLGRTLKRFSSCAVFAVDSLAARAGARALGAARERSSSIELIVAALPAGRGQHYVGHYAVIGALPTGVTERGADQLLPIALETGREPAIEDLSAAVADLPASSGLVLAPHDTSEHGARDGVVRVDAEAAAVAVGCLVAAEFASDGATGDPADPARPVQTDGSGLLPRYIRPPACEEVYEERRSAAIARAAERRGDAPSR